MKTRRIYLIFLALGSLLLSFALVTPFFIMKDGGVGIIGGADLSTYAYVISRPWLMLPLILGASITVYSLICTVFFNTVKNVCALKTTLLALMISAVGSVGLLCAVEWFIIAFFAGVSKHPIAYPLSIIGGLVSLFALIILIVFYCYVRKKSPQLLGICIDVFTSVIFLPSFFYISALLLNAV